MLKDLIKLMCGNRDFRNHSGVYLRCSCGPRTKRIGDADSIERYLAPSSQRTEFGCYQCRKMGTGCWGPMKEIRNA